MRPFAVAVMALSLLAGWGAARSTAPQPEPAPAAPPKWVGTRLEKLAPDHPEDYFRLAEELADTPSDPAAVALAETLYTLAYELSRRKPETAGLAASSCLGLAALKRLDQDRLWLRAVAAAVDPRYASPDWSVAASPAASEETAHKAATVLGLARSGDGLQARKLFAEPGVRDLLDDYQRALSSAGGRGPLYRLERNIAEWPCSQCNNARVIARPGPQGAELRLCPTCRGNPGPLMSAVETLAQLRFEAILLRGVQRSWAAQAAVDFGAVLRDPDPEQLAAAYGVDTTRTLWRDGAWVPADGGRP
ncbi:MAG: hypothetical protein ACKVU4_11325 [Phycisphaerales bacterium]